MTFLSDHDGAWNAWVSQVGTGDIYNLTKGSVPELRNPGTRTLGFNPDGTLVTLWRRVRIPTGAARSMPGGRFRRWAARFAPI